MSDTTKRCICPSESRRACYGLRYHGYHVHGSGEHGDGEECECSCHDDYERDRADEQDDDL